MVTKIVDVEKRQGPEGQGEQSSRRTTRRRPAAQEPMIGADVQMDLGDGNVHPPKGGVIWSRGF